MAFASTAKKLRQACRSYLGNTRGNMTMIMGFASIPVIAAAGMAIDYARISRVHDEIQLIADGATLAAASAKNLSGTSDEKKKTRVDIATSYLTNGLAAVTDAEVIGTPVVSATSSKVLVSVKATVKGSLINVLDVGNKTDAEFGDGGGGDQDGSSDGRKFDIEISSKATWTSGLNYVCLLALNPTDPESLSLNGMASVVSKKCAVQVNSDSNQALLESGTASMTASKISVKGNYVGSNYTPMPQTDADVFNDPLAAKFAVDYAATYGSAPLIYSSTAQMSFSAGSSTLNPGVYKGGIRVGNSVDLHLNPGVYFIKDGEFEIRSGGTVTGDGVTLVFTGNSKSRILIQAGGNLNVKAPGEGLPFASLVIAQHPSSIPLPNKENLIIGGGGLEMTGIMYFPKQTIKITGGGNISQTAPLFAIAADKIYIEGNAPLNIGQAADSDEAGLPALPSLGSGTAQVVLQ